MMEQVFESLKDCIYQVLILHAPDLINQFNFQRNAPDRWLGALLAQEIDGTKYPILYLQEEGDMLLFNTRPLLPAG